MSYKFVEGDFKSLSRTWHSLSAKSISNPIFSSLEWTQAWWSNLNTGFTIYIGAVTSGSSSIGIAPLMLKEDSAFLIGSEDVCDFLDFIICPGYEEIFFKKLINHLIENGISRLDMFPVKQDSSVMTSLLSLCQQTGLSISVNKTDVSPHLLLPKTWETYLQMLSPKQRHELKRKIRRLQETGEIKFHTLLNSDKKNIDIFFNLFRNSREDKAKFLSASIETFFREIFPIIAELNYFRLNILEINNVPIAETICFDYKNERLLYNSGYDKNYSWLSAGLISKALCIQESIQQGMTKFDFLRGNEDYKYQLGAIEAPIYRCNILLGNKI